jgi:hypothetical protein
MRRSLTGIVPAGIVLAMLLTAQTKYTGPKPERKDVPYLILASNLVQTEVARPVPKEDGGMTTWSIPGESSLAKTPLGLPAFVIDAATISPAKLRMYPFELKGAHRELTLGKNGAGDTQPILITVSNLSGTLYRIEVVNEVPNGEYGLTIPGSNQFFCFSVF